MTHMQNSYSIITLHILELYETSNLVHRRITLRYDLWAASVYGECPKRSHTLH